MLSKYKYFNLYLIGIPRADEGFKVKGGVSCRQGVWGHLEIPSGSIAKPWREPMEGGGARSPRKLFDSAVISSKASTAFQKYKEHFS